MDFYIRTVLVRYPDRKAKVVIFGYDDGAPQDKRLDRVTELQL